MTKDTLGSTPENTTAQSPDRDAIAEVMNTTPDYLTFTDLGTEITSGEPTGEIKIRFTNANGNDINAATLASLKDPTKYVLRHCKSVRIGDAWDTITPSSVAITRVSADSVDIAITVDATPVATKAALQLRATGALGTDMNIIPNVTNFHTSNAN